MEVGVVGAGTMGLGIAMVAAAAGDRVVLSDSSPAALSVGLATIEKNLARRREKQQLSAADEVAIMSRITTRSDIEAFSGCELVIEAVVERLEVKQELFRALDLLVSPSAVLASNTSSLSITAIASACSRSERVIGFHFFNPAPILPLVEIVRPLQAAESAVNFGLATAARWGKKPISVIDTPAFVVNRVARPFYGEALRILEEGIADEATIDEAMKHLGGFKMGPFELMDLIGIDVNYLVTESVFKSFAYDSRYRPSIRQQRMVEAGYLGRKSGRGFYRYEDGAAKPTAVSNESLQRKIFERILAMLINEAVDALFWRVASAAEIDRAVVLGMNYPQGLLNWGEQLGWYWVLERLDELHLAYREERYRPSPLLLRAVREGLTLVDAK